MPSISPVPSAAGLEKSVESALEGFFAVLRRIVGALAAIVLDVEALLVEKAAKAEGSKPAVRA